MELGERPPLSLAGIERAMVDTPQGEGEMERNQEAAPPGGRRRSIEDKFSLFRREESVTSPKSS